MSTKVLKSEKLFYQLIKAKAKEDGVKLSRNEINEFFEDAYWDLDSDLDLHFHNVKAFEEGE